jgi:hypothetical protein
MLMLHISVALMMGRASQAIVNSLATPIGYSTMNPEYLHTIEHGVLLVFSVMDTGKAS